MVGRSKIKIAESVETLKALLGKQKTPENFQKIQVLYLLKSKQAETITKVSMIIGRHRITIQGWLRCYQNEGIEGLIARKTKTGRKSSVPEDIIHILADKLLYSSDFSSYKQIQTWLETNFKSVMM